MLGPLPDSLTEQWVLLQRWLPVIHVIARHSGMDRRELLDAERELQGPARPEAIDHWSATELAFGNDFKEGMNPLCHRAERPTIELQINALFPAHALRVMADNVCEGRRVTFGTAPACDIPCRRVGQLSKGGMLPSASKRQED